HRTVTGHGGGDVHQPPLERQRLVPFGYVVGKIVDERLRIDLAEQRRRLAHRNSAGTKRLKQKAEASQLIGARYKPLDIGLVQLDNLGNEQNLSRDAAFFQRRLQALVDDALVRRVLIDNDEAVFGLRDD